MFKSWSVKRSMVMFAALVLGLSLVVPCVYAKGGGGGKGNEGSPGPGFEPKGWDEGKKEGWKGAEEPPGLAKQDTSKNVGKNTAKGKDKKKKGKRKGKKEEKKENVQAKEHEKEKKEK